jgi:hypothetical protein
MDKFARMSLRGLLRNPKFKSRKLETLAEILGTDTDYVIERADEIGAVVNSNDYVSLPGHTVTCAC